MAQTLRSKFFRYHTSLVDYINGRTSPGEVKDWMAIPKADIQQLDYDCDQGRWYLFFWWDKEDHVHEEVEYEPAASPDFHTNDTRSNV